MAAQTGESSHAARWGRFPVLPRPLSQLSSPSEVRTCVEIHGEAGAAKLRLALLLPAGAALRRRQGQVPP